MITVYGPCATADGATWWTDEVVHRAPGDRLIVEQHQRFGTLRADEFDRWQPAQIGVDIGHNDRPIGKVVFLERAEGGLSAVAVIDDLEARDLDASGQLKFSTQTATDRTTGSVQLRSVAIVKAVDAAAVGLGTVSWVDGDIRAGALRTIGIGQIPPLLARAEAWCKRYRPWDQPLEIVERQAVTAARAEVTHPDHPPVAPRSNSGHFKTIDGRRVEIFHSAPVGRVLSVR